MLQLAILLLFVNIKGKYMSSSVRTKRDMLLVECDWMFTFTDRPIQNREAWAAYRQELRDITKQTGFPDDVIWPTRPDFVLPSIEVTRV